MSFDLKFTDLGEMTKGILIQLIITIPVFFIILYIHDSAFIELSIKTLNGKTFLLISLLIYIPIIFYLYNNLLEILIHQEKASDFSNTITNMVTSISLLILLLLKYYVQINTTYSIICLFGIPIILNLIPKLYKLFSRQ